MNTINRISCFRSTEENFAFQVENQPFSEHFYYGMATVDIDSAVPSHSILGFGASFSDAACYLIARLPEARRDELLRRLFAPEGLNLSVGRLNVGSSDYATEPYSYNDTPDDLAMKHFSIAHDEPYLIPLVKRARALRPNLFLLASPWSPPGWMKTGGSLCGGYMRAKYLPAFADYYTAYLCAYRAAGLPIDAATMQNEADIEQGGRMPQSVLHPDFEMELVGRLMPERLRSAGLDTRLWLYDHNYSGWPRVLYMLSDPEVRRHVDGVAFHPYAGDPEMLGAIRRQYPDLAFHLTEKGPNLRKNSAESKLLWWSHTITGALNGGCRSFFGWNLALDENGAPNIGPFDCAGLVEIHAQTGAVTPSMQYHAFRHYAPFIQRNAKVLRCSSNIPVPAGIDCLVCQNPDGGIVAVLGNSGENTSLQLKWQGRFLAVSLPRETMTTVTL